MGKALVIAEKPSVGRDLAAALPGRFEKHEAFLESDEYVITWAVGHLVELAEPEDYDERLKKWRMADLPIVPDGFRLKPRDAKSRKQLSAIRKLLARPDVDRVINACDAGREGELIFAYIYESAGATKPVDRLWISSMTKQAIREGFERLRPGSQLEPLEAAARSRSEADWLVGMNATRAATIRGRAWVGGVVSLGRVQTPTLAMIVKREREIQAFVPEPYWLVRAAFQPLYEGLWFERDETRIKKAARADEIVERVSSNDGVVDSVERREQPGRPPPLSPPPPPQRDANRRFGFSARRTLQAAQSLYEGKKAITYPRTSSRYLSGDMVSLLEPTAETLTPIEDYRAAAEYVLALEQLPLARVVNDAKVDDHHAIIPTDIEHDLEDFSPDERRVFDLIARRFLAVFHPPARYARTTVITVVEEERFRTRGKVTLEAGWRRVYGVEADEPQTQRQDEDAEGEGDGRQARRRRGVARGDEGARARHAGDAGGDHRDADPARVRRARLQGAPADPEGPPGRDDARDQRSYVARADRWLGEAASRHRARERRPRRLHDRNRRLHEGDRGRDREPGQGEAPAGAGRARTVSALRRGNRRDHPRECEGLRLYELEEPRGTRLRLRDLEAGRGPDAHSRDREAATRGRADA